METLDGFTIEKRELTEEEANREITFERFQEYHYTVGEDFVDQHSFVNHKIFGGYMMALYPDCSKDILRVLNYPYGEALGLQEVYTDRLGQEEGCNAFYTDLAKFANLTKNLKKNINQVLIQISEYYKK